MSTETRVGMFVTLSAALIVGGFFATWDGVTPGAGAYDVTVTVPSADGLWPGTPVRLAGVEVGAIQDVAVSGRAARLTLRIHDDHSLPADTTVELRSQGMLGDRFVVVLPGDSETAAKDGDTLNFGEPPLDFDALGRDARSVAKRIEGAAAGLEQSLDEENQQNLAKSLEQLAELTGDLARTARSNRDDIDAVVRHMRRLTAELDRLVHATSPNIEGGAKELRDGIGEVRAATAKADAAIADLKSITEKVDRGEGSLGVLVNDRQLVDRLDRTLGRVEGVSGPAHGELWATGRLYGLEDGPITGGAIGGAVGQPELWVSGQIAAVPEARGSLRVHRRWGPVSANAGMFEGAEGIGLDGHLLSDRVRLEANARDFVGRFGDRGGAPNLRLGIRGEPMPYLWTEAVVEELVSGGTPSGYLGAGVYLRQAPDK